MAVTTTNRFAGPFFGNNTATVFPFTFKVFDTTDLYVVRVNINVGDNAVLELGVDYTVTLNGDQDTDPGGAVTLISGALATGFKMIMTSDIAQLQEVILQNQGGFYPTVLNAAYDRLTILVQQLQQQANRAIQVSITDDASSVLLPPAAQRINMVPFFGADGSLELVTGAQFQGPPGDPGLPGPQGVPGQPGAPGTVTLDSVDGNFLVTGQINAANAVDSLTKIWTSGPAGIPTVPPVNHSTYLAYGPGWSLGNGSGGGWSTGANHVLDGTYYTRGITQNILTRMDKRAVGDTAGMYMYVHVDPGCTASSDEGSTGITSQVLENTGHMHGVIRSTTGTGDKTPVITCTTGPQWTTDGCCLLNISKGTISGNLNGDSVYLQNSLFYFPVTGVTLPLSTAAGTVNADTTVPNVSMDQEIVVNIELTLSLIGGVAKPFAPGPCVIAGTEYPQQATIVSVSTVVGLVQTITVGIRYQHRAGSMVFQGGIAGQCISFDAQMALNAGTTNRRTTYPAFGSLTGTDMIYAEYKNGGFGGLRLELSQGYIAAATTGSRSGFHLYPYAEVVANTTPGSVNVSGDQVINALVEPNGVAWQVGDVVECPHHYIATGSILNIVEQKDAPTNATLGSSLFLLRAGGQGVAGYRYKFRGVQNLNPPLLYWSAPVSGVPPTQGPLAMPLFEEILGSFQDYSFIDQAPGIGGSIILVNNFANNNDPAALHTYSLFRAPGKFGAVSIQVEQSTSRFLMSETAFSGIDLGATAKIVMAGSSSIDFTGNTAGGITKAALVETTQLRLLGETDTVEPNGSIECRISLDGGATYKFAKIPVFYTA